MSPTRKIKIVIVVFSLFLSLVIMAFVLNSEKPVESFDVSCLKYSFDTSNKDGNIKLSRNEWNHVKYAPDDFCNESRGISHLRINYSLKGKSAVNSRETFLDEPYDFRVSISRFNESMLSVLEDNMNSRMQNDLYESQSFQANFLNEVVFFVVTRYKNSNSVMMGAYKVLDNQLIIELEYKLKCDELEMEDHIDFFKNLIESFNLENVN